MSLGAFARKVSTDEGGLSQSPPSLILLTFLPSYRRFYRFRPVVDGHPKSEAARREPIRRPSKAVRRPAGRSSAPVIRTRLGAAPRGLPAPLPAIAAGRPGWG
jgi:hypothetical protein